MKKIIKVLISLILIGIIANSILSGYVEEKSDISRKIGSKWAGGQISTYNYSAIVRNFEYYIGLIKKEDYNAAYKMLPYEYECYKPYEEYLKEVKNINYDEIQVTEVIKRTDNMYSIIFSTSELENMEYVMIFNEENTAFTITPETFLDFEEYDKKIKKKSVKYELISTTNYIDKYIVNLVITNNNKKETVNISDIKLVLNDIKKIASNITNLKIDPEESKNVKLEFETYIDFPNKIEISRLLESKNKTENYILNITEN